MSANTYQAVTGTAPLSATAFPPGSRYNGVPIANYVAPDGQQIPYLQQRLLPAPAGFTTLQIYTVVQGDRLDNVAAKFLGDPLQFWRICDANGAMRPEDLTATIGRSLRITLPQGILGPSNA